MKRLGNWHCISSISDSECVLAFYSCVYCIYCRPMCARTALIDYSSTNPSAFVIEYKCADSCTVGVVHYTGMCVCV